MKTLKQYLKQAAEDIFQAVVFLITVIVILLTQTDQQLQTIDLMIAQHNYTFLIISIIGIAVISFVCEKAIIAILQILLILHIIRILIKIITGKYKF